MKYKGYEIEIKPDECGESPREMDNLGTMVCFHRRYTLGDKHGWTEPSEFHDWLVKQEKEGAVVLSLYLYDHSGITMNTTGFSCPWDSGQVGVIFVQKEKVLKEFSKGKLTAALRKKVEKILVSEVGTYDQFIRGDVYGYVINGPELEDDSCWGYYGEDDALAEAKSVVDYVTKGKSIKRWESEAMAL